ncbi:MAG: translation elongation factor-like protein [Candidatus Eisenbacteria bacterium]|nr:translation elongation factor-like protein [Candidatus Eisenbacteria bacterium]
MEKKVGHVVGYFSHVGVAAILLSDDSLSVGDVIHFRGHTTDLEQTVESMEIDHKPIEKAAKGSDVGIRVKDRVRHNDAVYKIIPD